MDNRKRERDSLQEEQLGQIDSEMKNSTGGSGQTQNEIKERIIKKVKRKSAKPENDSGTVGDEELEFEDSDVEKSSGEDEIVQHDDDDEDGGWEDCSSASGDDEKMSDKAKITNSKDSANKKEPLKVWNEVKEPLQEDEELIYDGSAYQMLHRSQVEWPCLSLDFVLRERSAVAGGGIANARSWFPTLCNGQLSPEQTVFDRNNIAKHRQDKFPLSVYMVAGSQAQKRSDNRIYVVKWSNMHQTVNEDLSDSDDDSGSEGEDKRKAAQPVIRFESVPHRGAINRIRTMHGSPIVATWSEDCELSIFDISAALEEVDRPVSSGKRALGGCKLSSFKHRSEGYALDWSPLSFGRLASGTCDAQLWLCQAADETCSSFVRETQVGLQGHKGSIEDVQWSPTQDHVLASCSVDQTIKLWDLRATQQRPQISWTAHDCDINVISWNTATKFLLASGDDKGEFKIWDLRMLPGGANKQAFGREAQLDPITQIRWHTQAITSLQFEPREDSVLAVSSADNKLTLWDFSVEVDDSMPQQVDVNEEMEIPPQLMFLHQGQNDLKELRFHPQFHTLIATTAIDSFNIFRPNLDPEDEANQLPDASMQDLASAEESKEVSTSSASRSTTVAMGSGRHRASADSSDDEGYEEQARARRIARQLNKQRRARSSSKKQQQKRTRQE